MIFKRVSIANVIGGAAVLLGSFSHVFGVDLFSISGDISAVVFDDTSKKYYLAKTDIEVPPGKSVHIPAGTVIFFQLGTTFFIKGSCSAEGTESEPVVFSSVNEPAAPFDWEGIRILESAGNVVFNHVHIKNASLPLESYALDIQLKNVYRIQTENAFFTINGEQRKVKSDEPFFYPPPLPQGDAVSGLSTEGIAASSASPSPAEKPAIVIPPEKESPWWKKGAVRWTLLGTAGASALAVGGCIWGYYAKDAEYDREMKIYYDETIRNFPQRINAKETANKAAAAQKNFKQAGIISGIAGAVLLTGFGLTFVF